MVTTGSGGHRAPHWQQHRADAGRSVGVPDGVRKAKLTWYCCPSKYGGGRRFTWAGRRRRRTVSWKRCSWALNRGWRASCSTRRTRSSFCGSASWVSANTADTPRVCSRAAALHPSRRHMSSMARGKLPGAIYPRLETSEQRQQRLPILWRLLPDPQGRFERQSLSHHSGL